MLYSQRTKLVQIILRLIVIQQLYHVQVRDSIVSNVFSPFVRYYKHDRSTEMILLFFECLGIGIETAVCSEVCWVAGAYGYMIVRYTQRCTV